jgi:hypothetical protein
MKAHIKGTLHGGHKGNTLTNHTDFLVVIQARNKLLGTHINYPKVLTEPL